MIWVLPVRKPRKYPIFRIPPDTSFPPHFSTGYLDTNFFLLTFLYGSW